MVRSGGRRVTDIHPDDETARRRFLDGIRQRREELGLSQFAAAARLTGEFRRGAWNRFEVRVADLTQSANPKVSTLQAYGDVLDMRPVVTIVGLVVPDTMATAVYEAMHTALGERMAVMSRLVAAREHLGYSLADLAPAMRVTGSAIRQMEEAGDSLLSTWQRYARALGELSGVDSRLDLAWQILPDAEAEIPVDAPLPLAG